MGGRSSYLSATPGPLPSLEYCSSSGSRHPQQQLPRGSYPDSYPDSYPGSYPGPLPSLEYCSSSEGLVSRLSCSCSRSSLLTL